MPKSRLLYQPYIEELKNRMGLRDWDIVMSDENPPDTAAADMTAIQGRKLVFVRLHSESLKLSREKVRYLFVHELVHCHFAGMHNYYDAVSSGLSESTAMDHFYEYGIDATARIIAPFMPLPAPGTKKGYTL